MGTKGAGMPRSDRLMSLIHILRDGGTHRAGDLATRLKVSVRTIYRDMDTLAASGVPITGERGTGYRVLDSITLPPMHLTVEEVEALQLGLSAVAQTGDRTLAAVAGELIEKFDAIMPDDSQTGLATHPFATAMRSSQYLPMIRQAIRSRQKLQVDWGTGQSVLRPLQLLFWARLWTCIAWDETKDRFADIRLDQVTSLSVLPGLFVDESGKTLSDYNSLQGKLTANDQYQSEV